MALAGGVTVRVPQRGGYFYTAGSILSPDGHCRPFDANAQGTIVGSGVGLVVLKRLEDALADGDNVRAVILGTGLEQRRQRQGGLHRAELPRSGRGDPRRARHVGRLAPSRSATSRRTARARSSATRSRSRALNEVFKADTDRRGFCGDRLGEIELRPPVVCGRCRGSDQVGARARARRDPADRALHEAEPGDRLRVGARSTSRHGCSHGSGTARRGAPASARSASAAPTRTSSSKRRQRAAGASERRSHQLLVFRREPKPRSMPRRRRLASHLESHPRASIWPTSRLRCRSDDGRFPHRRVIVAAATIGTALSRRCSRAACARARLRPQRAPGRVHVPGPGIAIPRHGSGPVQQRAGRSRGDRSLRTDPRSSRSAPTCGSCCFHPRASGRDAAEELERHAMGATGAVHGWLRARRVVAILGRSSRRR